MTIHVEGRVKSRENGGRDRCAFCKFGRFLFAGLVNAGAGFLLFLFFFNVLGLHYLLANGLVFVSWAWFGFELQRRWTFRVRLSKYAWGRFLLNQIIFFGLGVTILWTLVEVFAARAEPAYLLTLAMISVGMYLSSLFWVFRGADISRE